jgi:hypothetical protein
MTSDARDPDPTMQEPLASRSSDGCAAAPGRKTTGSGSTSARLTWIVLVLVDSSMPNGIISAPRLQVVSFLRAMRALYWALAGAMVCAWPTRALAAPPEAGAAPQDDDESRRSALYREGIQLAEAGRWAEAVARFREVVAIREAPRALYTLAQAEEHTGALATAARTYERALAGARSASAADVAQSAAAALAIIEPRIPRIVVGLERPSEGATATVDGVPANFGDPVRVDPGEHQVSVVAPGRKPSTSVVRIAEGQVLRVAKALAPDTTPEEPAASTTPAERPPSERAPFPTVPVIVAGVGLAFGVAGVTLRLVGQSRYDTASGNCPGGVCPRPSDAETGNEGRGQIIIGDVLLGVGGAALAGAALLWFFEPRAARDSGVHASVQPYRDGAFASVSGRF